MFRRSDLPSELWLSCGVLVTSTLIKVSFLSWSYQGLSRPPNEFKVMQFFTLQSLLIVINSHTMFIGTIHARDYPEFNRNDYYNSYRKKAVAVSARS